jgi:hypothetical protein
LSTRGGTFVDDCRIANIAAAIANVARYAMRDGKARSRGAATYSLAAMRKLVIPLVVLAVAGGALFWLHSRDQDVSAEHDAQQQATAAMADVTATQATIGNRLKQATLDVATTGLVSVARAGDLIKNELMPIIDDYLGKLERALAMSQAYLAFHPELDDQARSALASMSTRAKQVHIARDRLADLAERASKGTLSVDDLGAQLANAAKALVTPL